MGPAPDVEAFVELFSQLPDPRVERTRRHSLESILFLCVCGVVCGANDPVSIERFGESRREFVERFVELPFGIPSHDTIGRILAKLDPEALESLFARWMRGVATATHEGVVAIDSKTLRRAFDKANAGAFITMVSAWNTANGVVLGRVGTAEGSNEIEAFPRLLDLPHIKGCLVTIDAAGCQTDIASKIIDKGGDYLLAVRDNQPKLYAAVKEAFDDLRATKRSPGRGRCATTTEAGHGREEKRTCAVLPLSDDFPEAARWLGLARLVLFESERTMNGKETRGSTLAMSTKAAVTADATAASRIASRHKDFVD